MRVLCLWVVNYETALSWLGTAGRSVQKRFVSRSSAFLGLNVCSMRFSNGQSTGLTAEVKVILTAFLNSSDLTDH